MSDTFTVERSTTINAAPGDVYPHVSDFKKWAEWSPWDDMDPNMDKRYSGPEQGTGAKYAWKGNRKVGEGRMEITDTTEPSRVEIGLEFIKPFKSRNRTVFSMEPAGDSTTVTWTMTGRKTFLTKVMGIFKSMDSMVGPDFEKGLSRLKTAVESKA